MRSFKNVEPRDFVADRDGIRTRANASRTGVLDDVAFHEVPVISTRVDSHAGQGEDKIWSGYNASDFEKDDIVTVWYDGSYYPAQIKAVNTRANTVTVRFSDTTYNVPDYPTRLVFIENPDESLSSDDDVDAY